MANLYAGILGLIAFLTVLIRAAIAGGGFEGTIQAGCVALAVFATLGFLAGKAATFVVDESVRLQLRDEWKEVTGQVSEENQQAG